MNRKVNGSRADRKVLTISECTGEIWAAVANAVPPSEARIFDDEMVEWDPGAKPLIGRQEC